MRISVLLGTLALLGGCAALGTNTPPATDLGQQLAFVNVNVVDVERGRILPDATVVLDGNRIVKVSSGRVSLPPGIKRVDGTGKYLIPGLWDMYTFAFDGVQRGEPVLELLVAHGVTGIREMGSVMDLAKQRSLRKEILEGRRAGPRIAYAGRRLVAPTVRTTAATAVVSTAAEAAATIASLKQAGAEVVVAAAALTPDLHAAVAAEARKQGMSSSAWVVSGWIDAAGTGLQAIDHPADLHRSTSLHRQEFFDFYARHQFTPLPPREQADPLFARMEATPDRPYYLETIRALALNGVYLTTNLGSFYFARRDWEFADPARAIFHLREAVAEMAAGTEEGTYIGRARMRMLEALGDMHRAGVKLLPGTNAREVGRATPGMTLHDELERFVLAGMRPAEVLHAATLSAATFLGRADQLGSVTEGKLADLVLLDANPLENIRNVRGIRAVVVNGRPYTREELDALIRSGAEFIADKNRRNGP